MAEVDLTLQITDQVTSKENSTEHPSGIKQIKISSSTRNYKWWIRIILYTIFLLCGQSFATILGRLYFEKGGTSKWLATLVQVVGFPVLIPCYCILLRKNLTSNTIIINSNSTSFLKLMTMLYIPFGLLAAGSSFLFSVGFQYLPVSIMTLITASQLGFNAFFSYFLNSQKFTAPIINSLVLLTMSSVLLVFNNKTEKPAGVTRGEYAAGFLCTVGGAAVVGLLLASQQLAFRKVLKKQTLRVVIDVIFFQSLVASCVLLVGLFASGEFRGLKNEMERYALGNVSYSMTLIWIAVGWQVFLIGTVGLILEVSSLYSIAISTVGLPIVPVLAVFVFDDEMDGIKGMSMVLAIWGFVSYVYQHYMEPKKENLMASDVADEDCFPAGEVHLVESRA